MVSGPSTAVQKDCRRYVLDAVLSAHPDAAAEYQEGAEFRVRLDMGVDLLLGMLLGHLDTMVAQSRENREQAQKMAGAMSMSGNRLVVTPEHLGLAWVPDVSGEDVAGARFAADLGGHPHPHVVRRHVEDDPQWSEDLGGL